MDISGRRNYRFKVTIMEPCKAHLGMVIESVAGTEFIWRWERIMEKRLGKSVEIRLW